MTFDIINTYYVYVAWALTGAATVHLLFLTLRRVSVVFDLFSHYTLLMWLILLINLGVTAALRLQTVTIITTAVLLIMTLFVAEYFKRAPTLKDSRLEGVGVMSYNVKYSNPRRSEAIDYILEARPDALALFEVNRDWEWYLLRLKNAYPYSVSEVDVDDGAGVALFSKYPLVGEVKLFEDIPYVDARLSYKNSELRVIALHAFNPIRVWRDHWRKGMRLISQIADDIDFDAPTVVASDLNSSPNGAFYRAMVENGKLMPAGRGRMFLPTWGPFGLPLLQIDHIFVTRGVQTLFDGIGPRNGSDHRPISTVVTWRSGVAA